jgi:hypothetical protein
MSSKLRAFAKKTRKGLKKYGPAIYEACYANLSDEDMPKDLRAKKAMLDSSPGETIRVVVRYPAVQPGR